MAENLPVSETNGAQVPTEAATTATAIEENDPENIFMINLKSALDKVVSRCLQSLRYYSIKIRPVWNLHLTLNVLKIIYCS